MRMSQSLSLVLTKRIEGRADGDRTMNILAPCPQIVGHRPAARASLESLLEMENRKPPPRGTQSESAFEQTSRQFLCASQFKKTLL